jgi:hypothetical protein
MTVWAMGVMLIGARAAGSTNVVTAVATCGVDGAGVSVASWSRLLPVALDIVHVSVQHGIDCIEAIVAAGCPRQHTAAAGTVAVTNNTSATVITVAKRFVIDLWSCTLSRTSACNVLFRCPPGQCGLSHASRDDRYPQKRSGRYSKFCIAATTSGEIGLRKKVSASTLAFGIA